MSEIKQKSLKKYRKMIKWAKTQDPDEEPYRQKMFKAIGQDWFGESCPYCQEYRTSWDTCGKCPLEFKAGCCGDFWENMDDSETWAKWIVNAEKVEQYIRNNG